MQPSPRLLLIEDDPGAASSLKRLLAAEGYTVETAQFFDCITVDAGSRAARDS